MREISKDSLLRISGSFGSEADRSVAILAASLLDDQLKTLLEKFLVSDSHKAKMFGTFVPLSTFSAKFEMAYLLALIPKDVRDDIDIVRKIRNHFAHRIENVAFDKPPVSDLVVNLKAVQWALDNINPADKRLSQRKRFELAVSLVSLTLDGYIEDTKPLTAKNNEYRWEH